MSDVDTARRWTIRHFHPIDDSEATAQAQATAHLRELIRDEGYVLDADSIEQGAMTAIVLDDLDQRGYREARAGEAPSGHIVEWSATATEKHRDEEPIDSTPAGDDRVTATVPEHIAAGGGGVRVRHNLGGPVTVAAFSGKNPVGYLFAQDIDENVEYVELVPGATHLLVTRDPDEEDAAEDGQ